jgi:mono/diheme cytochrome c family protein
MKIKTLLIFASAIIFISSFTLISNIDEWKAPADAAAVKNPTKVGDNADAGKALWAKHCKSCHGTTGKGDGPKAEDLDSDMPDLSKLQGQSDGSLFYKTNVGKDDMPGFKKKIPSDDDRWLLVNYMRTACK